MGSQLIKGYTIEKESKGTVGANNMWKLHDAVKQGSNQPASVLIIQKKSLPKGEKQQIIKMCKKQATSLAKFKHPNIISITEALLEDEHSMGFVVERVEGNIKTLVQSGKFTDHCSSQLQLKIHILQLLEALNFLHNSVKLVHLGINLNNVYITHEGKWKLGGFTFSQNLINEGLSDCQNKPNQFSYMSPQVAIQSKCSYQSDTFSLIVLALTLLEHIKRPSKNLTPIINASSKSDYQKHKQIFSRIDKHPFISSSQTPNQLAKLATETIQWQWQKRKQLSQVSNSQWLTDSFTTTIKHLSSIINLEQKMQLQFLKGLSATALKFEPSIIKKRIIPTLLELMKFDYLVAGIILTLIELLKKQIVSVPEFQKSIWGPLKSLTQGKQMSAHALYLFVSNIQVLAKFISLQDLNATIIPLYIKCFDCPNKLKEIALRKVQFLSKKLQYQFIKSKILPKILGLFVDKTLQIRKLALICIYKSAASYDSQVITDQILPALDKLRKAGGDSFSNAITLKLYTVFSKNLSIQIIGNKIIPNLVPYLVDSGISNTDFELYKNTINSLMDKIQNQRSKNPSSVESQIYTDEDFDFPKEQKKQEIVKQQVQPNFDFLSMFKSSQQPSNNQSINQDFNLGFGGGNLDFNAFNNSTPLNNINNNNIIGSNSLDFGGFSSGTGQTTIQQPKFQLPKTQNKSLDAAADQFFGFLQEKKPSPPAPVIQKPKVVLKGPPSSQKPSTISPPKQSQPQAQQQLYSFNMNSTNQANPFADIQKQMNSDFGDFSDFSQSNNNNNNQFNFASPINNSTFNISSPPIQNNFNAFQSTPAPQNNLNLNFLNPTNNNNNKLSGSTKNINQISGDSFFDLL